MKNQWPGISGHFPRVSGNWTGVSAHFFSNFLGSSHKFIQRIQPGLLAALGAIHEGLQDFCYPLDSQMLPAVLHPAKGHQPPFPQPLGSEAWFDLPELEDDGHGLGIKCRN